MCACCLQTCPRSTPHGPEQATLITDTGTGSGILAAVAVVTANTSQSSPGVADVSADAVDVAAAVPGADGATARSAEAAMTCTVAVVAATSGITCNAAGVIAAGVIAAGVIAAAASAAAAAAGVIAAAASAGVIAGDSSDIGYIIIANIGRTDAADAASVSSAARFTPAPCCAPSGFACVSVEGSRAACKAARCRPVPTVSCQLHIRP